MASLTPRFSSNRMLREYVESVYLPAARECRARSAGGAAIARDLAVWERRLSEHWHAVAFVSVDHSLCCNGLHLTAVVQLGELTPEEVRAEIVADPVPGEDAVCAPMAMTRSDHGMECQVHVTTTRPPNHFTARVMPAHPHALRSEVPLILWAG